MSLKSFRELGASSPVVDALAARSIVHPFRIQELVLPDAFAGLDVLARSPTGSGKTLARASRLPRPTAACLLVRRPGASRERRSSSLRPDASRIS
jgi:hypothetical protein